MIILDTTLRTLQALLGGAITTNQLQIVVGYCDMTTTTFVPAPQVSVTNDTTPVTIVSAPAASTQRQIKYISIENTDTVSQTVTVRYNDNGTTYNLVVQALSAGQTLQYTDTDGWTLACTSGGGGGGSGTVTSITAGTGLTGGTITTSGTIALSVPVTVPNGGTGDTTLAAHGVLVGEGASAIAVVGPGALWSVVTGQGASADPIFSSYFAANAALHLTLFQL